jgi:hypothetical protein
MKIFNLFLTALFVVSAALQYNDPDPLFWISLYLAAAVICVFAAFNKYNRWALLLLMAACIYELWVLGPAFMQWVKDGMPSITESMKASTPHVELVREFLGVFIVFVVVVFQYARSRFHAMRNTRIQTSA